MTFYCSDKHHDQKQLGEDRVYLGYTSQPDTSLREAKGGIQPRKVGTWRQELKQWPWRDDTYWLVLCGFAQLPFLYTPQPLAEGWHHPQRARYSSINYQSGKGSMDRVMGHFDAGTASVEVSSSLVYQGDKISYHSHDTVLTRIYLRQIKIGLDTVEQRYRGCFFTYLYPQPCVELVFSSLACSQYT